MPKIMLLDGMSLAHRAFYALPPLTTSRGEHVNAALGFLNTFYKLYEEERPDRIAVAFDLPAPTFRHKLFSAYKGTRDAMPAELRPQIPLLKTIIESMGVPIFSLEGYEADDLLGTMSKISGEKGYSVCLVTGDRDLLQTATDSVYVRIPTTKGGQALVNTFYAGDVKEKYGVTPSQFVDVKALWGDTSDNIPGVPSIGEKTASKIIQQFGSVEEAIKNADKVTPKKASENLVTYADQAMLSKKMAQIVMDAPVIFDPDTLPVPDIYGEKIGEMVRHLEFKSLYNKFAEPVTVKHVSEAAQVSADKAGEIADLMSGLSETAYVINYDGAMFQGVSLSGNGKEYFIKSSFGGLEEGPILEALSAFFEGPVKKTAWDSKSDERLLRGFGIGLNNVDFDVMLASYAANISNSAPESASRLLDMKENLLMSLKAQHMEKLYYDIELPLVPVLSGMERLGIRVDAEELKKYGTLLGKGIDALQSEIYNLTGEAFNINSPKQLGSVLFDSDKLGLKGGKKTKTGYSTAAEELERLASEHPAIPAIIEYRQLTKLKSTYADGLLSAMDKNTNRIYTTFNQAVTATGRLSSTEPNLQNIPVRTELGRELRKAFIPSEGYVFIDADYSQIELRVLAHMSGDETFIDAFKNDLDVHRITASEVFGVSLEHVTDSQRRAAKTVNFGIIYGQSAFSLANDLGISIADAEDYIQGYFRRYPRVRIFMDETVKQARQTGYTSTIMNRRREITELSSPNFNIRAFGERAAMNMPIQGSAADIIKIAMIRTHKRLETEGLGAKLILQVHDELLVECPFEEQENVMELLKFEMENAVTLEVPLKADVNAGKSWYEAK